MMKDGTRNLRLTQNAPTAQDSGAGCGLHHEHLSQENSASEGSHLINRDQTARLERLAAAARLANQIPLPAITYLPCLPGGQKSSESRSNPGQIGDPD